MKRLLACVSLVAVTTTAALSNPSPAVTPTTKPTAKAPVHHAPIGVAPADEYFGKLKMSILGIRNTIKDVGANIDVDPTRWTQLASKAAFAEDAMRDWERKYPRDTWLAKTVFSLERMYAKIDSEDGRTRTIAAMRWLVRDFSSSWYGKTGKREFAQGKVGRPVTPTAITAAPSPSPNPESTSSADQIAAPAPAPTAASSAFPQPTTPAGTVAPDQTASGTLPSPNPVPQPSVTPALPNPP